MFTSNELISEIQEGQVFESHYDIPTYGRMIVINAGHFDQDLKEFEDELLTIGAKRIKVKVQPPSTSKTLKNIHTGELINRDANGQLKVKYREFLVVPADNLANWLVTKINSGGFTDTLLIFALAIAEAVSADSVVNMITQKIANRMKGDVVSSVFEALSQQLGQYYVPEDALTVAREAIASGMLEVAQTRVDTMEKALKMLSSQFRAITLFVVKLSEQLENQRFLIPLENRPEVIRHFLDLRKVIGEVQLIMNKQTDYMGKINDIKNEINFRESNLGSIAQ
jgi:hypothetical protein